MIVDIIIHQKQLDISYVDKEGDIQIKNFSIPDKEQYNWIIAKNPSKADTEYKTWDGKLVQKAHLSGFKDKLSKWRVQEYLGSLPEEETSFLYEFNLPKMFFIDIEVGIDIAEGFPEPSHANQPVQTIAISHKDKNICFGTKSLSIDAIARIEEKINKHFQGAGINDQSSFKYFNLKTEQNLMTQFFKFTREKVQLMTGWFFLDFDWMYLRTRGNKIGVDPGLSSKSGKLTYRHRLPEHKITIDYMQIYKKWDRSVEIKESIGLDFTAKAVLGINKIKYDGSLQDLYNEDFEKYVFYNAVDSRLVQLIHEKINTLDIYFQLAHVAKIQSNDLKPLSPIFLAEAAMGAQFLEQKQIFPKLWEGKKKKEEYEGAFVFPATADLYEGVGSFDFKSLYPSTMRQFNMSPESYAFNIAKGEPNPDPDKYILSASGALFYKNKDSVFRKLLTKYNNDRQSAKQKMFKVGNERDYLKKLLEEKKQLKL